jgi:uncharacterized protein YndB with AHSA1/START domain
MSTTTIRASGQVAAPIEAVFRELSDLDAHRELAAPHIEIVDLHGPPGARTGGVVRLNGPLGVQKTARTAVRSATFPHELSGKAWDGDGSSGTLTWRLAPDDERTLVTAELTVRAGSARDALLLAAGGRAWLRRCLTTAIGRLALTPRAAASASS